MQTSVTEKSSRDDVIGAALECQEIDSTILKQNEARINDLEGKQATLFIVLGLVITYALVS